MTDVFISYSKHDRGRAASLAGLLEAEGYSVWWDHRLRGGDEFRDTIVEQIGAAKVTIVVWSPRSVESPWVRSEAELARTRATLLPVRVPELDATTIPPPFGVLHSIDITDADAILASLSAKIDLDEETRARVARMHRRRRRVRRAATVAAGLLVAAGALAWVSSASLRGAVESATLKTYYRLNPCENSAVFFNSEGSLRRLCVAAGEVASFRDCDGCPEMVVVHGGRFAIGSPLREQGRDVDEDQKEVEISSVAIGRFEVTLGQWKACVQDAGCRPRPNAAELTDDSHPAVYISWDDTQDYVRWLSGRTGRAYRLPSESEWEFAARAGTRSPRFWGHLASQACDYANIRDRTYLRAHPPENSDATLSIGMARGLHDCDDNYPRLAPAGRFKANDFGLHDVIGNVWEWVQDCAFPSYAPLPRDGSAYVADDCTVHMLRGGSFSSEPASTRSANRYQSGRNHSMALPDFGFRVARGLE